jgi:SET domain-containing protein
MIKPYLFVASSNGKGRGVFTNENIRSKSIIEISPVIVLPPKDRKTIDQTLLHDYIFEWGESRRQACIALGYVSLYNHSFTSNCEYEMDYDYQLITIRTVRSIKKGEELSINYNGTWNDARPLWFEVTGH